LRSKQTDGRIADLISSLTPELSINLPLFRHDQNVGRNGMAQPFEGMPTQKKTRRLSQSTALVGVTHLGSDRICSAQTEKARLIEEFGQTVLIPDAWLLQTTDLQMIRKNGGSPYASRIART